MLMLDLFMLAVCTVFVLWQYKRTGILLTPSNALLVGAIMLPVFVAYPLALSPDSLAAIGQGGHALFMQWAADELLEVICLGTVCVMLAYWAASRLIPRLSGKRCELPHSPRVALHQLAIGACIVCLFGVSNVFLFFIQQGQIPLFSAAEHSREILADGPPAPIYLHRRFHSGEYGIDFSDGGIVPRKDQTISALVLLRGDDGRHRESLYYFRGNLLAPFVSAGLIYFSLRNFKLTPFRAVCIAALLLCCASILQLIRTHAGVSLEGMWYEIIHGNTYFANFRDSSWVLMSFGANRYPFFHGKTILASLSGFVPSGILSFRQQFAWGNITLEVVHYTDPLHFGLGQVLFADWYVNFGNTPRAWLLKG